MKVRATNSRPMVLAVVVGFFAATVASFLLLLGLTSLIMNGSFDKDTAGVAVFFVRTVAVFLGCLIACGIYKERGVVVIGSVVGSYLVAILVTGIIAFDGFVQNFVSGLISVCLGGFLVLIIRLIPKKRTFHSVRHII